MTIAIRSTSIDWTTTCCKSKIRSKVSYPTSAKTMEAQLTMIRLRRMRRPGPTWWSRMCRADTPTERYGLILRRITRTGSMIWDYRWTSSNQKRLAEATALLISGMCSLSTTSFTIRRIIIGPNTPQTRPLISIMLPNSHWFPMRCRPVNSRTAILTTRWPNKRGRSFSRYWIRTISMFLWRYFLQSSLQTSQSTAVKFSSRVEQPKAKVWPQASSQRQGMDQTLQVHSTTKVEWRMASPTPSWEALWWSNNTKQLKWNSCIAPWTRIITTVRAQN